MARREPWFESRPDTEGAEEPVSGVAVLPREIASPAELGQPSAQAEPVAGGLAARLARAINRLATALTGLYLVALLLAVVAYKATFLDAFLGDPIFAGYSLLVAVYIVSRFGIAAFYRPSADVGHEPTVAVVMPAFNEEDVIRQTVESLLELDYPEAKLEIVVVNDGSTDGTEAEIDRLSAKYERIRAIHFPENRGKRAAMAAGMRATAADILVFIDSDSIVDPDGLRLLVQDFADPRVGAVAGHADVLNVRESIVTRMQAVRYFVAFRVMKAAESVFDAVTCCSGCFSAYRRSAVAPHLESWENQSYLGRPATFGDDRSLTNFVLREWKVRFQSRAISRTIVPGGFRQFMRQQMRWKRSWTRESMILGTFIWRKHPVASAATYLQSVLTVLAPLIAIRALFWQPAFEGTWPWLYLLGIYIVALLYGVYYEMKNKRADGLWVFGVLFVFFYLAFLLWQTYWAALTAHSTDWGTRGDRNTATETVS